MVACEERKVRPRRYGGGKRSDAPSVTGLTVTKTAAITAAPRSKIEPGVYREPDAGERERGAPWVSARMFWTRSTPAAPIAATPAVPPPLHRAAVGEALPGGGLYGKRDRALQERLAPAPRRPEIDMHEPRARIEAEAEEAGLPRSRLESDRIMVRHRDVEGGALHVLRALVALHGQRSRNLIGRSSSVSGL